MSTRKPMGADAGTLAARKSLPGAAPARARELELERQLLGLQQELARRDALLADAHVARAVDAGSGLPNRTAFVARLDELLAARCAGGARLLVMVVGIDRLAAVREALGFTLADQVARRIGERLLEAAPKVPLLARVGDEAYALVVELGRAAGDPATLARRLVEVIDSPLRVADQDLRLIATVGISRFPDDGVSAEMLLAHAQAAMRHAREHGTRPHQLYRAAIGARGERSVRLEAELRRAIDRQEFCVHYQPRRALVKGVDGAHGRIMGVE